jgi:DnaJ-domain-containing protein 1
VSFEDILAEVDRALAANDEVTALRRLDTAIVYGTVLRGIAASSSSKARQAEPLTLAALVEVHLQALRLHARLARSLDPAGFELTLLLRLAAMYAPDGRDDLPATTPELVAFCASRVEWIEAEGSQVNDAAAHYSSAFDWRSLRVALARLGYEFDEGPRVGGIGPFPPGERGRLEAAALLGVEAESRPAAIKKAYYREAAKHHPDRLGEAPDHLRLEAEERMKVINAAYELLTAVSA